MDRRRGVVGIVGVLVAIAVLGCGGSGVETRPEAQAGVSKAEYVKRVEHICQRRERQKYQRIAAAFKLSGLNSSELRKADLEEVTRKVIVPTLREMVEELEALPPSVQDQAKYDRVVENLSSELDEVEAEPALFMEGKAFAQSNDEATAIGIPECSLN